MEPITEVRDYIVEIIHAHGSLLGSQLGSEVRKVFPEFDLKRSYRGIRDFVERECAERVVVVGTSGADIMFASSESEQSKSTASEGMQKSRSAWLAFSNPSLKETVLVDEATGELSVKGASTAIDRSKKIVPSLTEEHYRKICTDFLANLHDPITLSLALILEQEGFWSEWARTIANVQGGRFQGMWMKYRKEAINREFHDRLEGLGLSPEVQDAAMRSLLRSKSPRMQKMPARAGTAVRHIPSTSIREVVYSAIGLMSDDEIRRLNIPFGLVYDAMSKPEK